MRPFERISVASWQVRPGGSTVESFAPVLGNFNADYDRLNIYQISCREFCRISLFGVEFIWSSLYGFRYNGVLVRDPGMKYPALTKAAAVLITIVLLAILLSQVNVADVVTTLTSSNPLYLVAGFFLYACSYVFRTLRFRFLLNGEVRMRDLFNIVCVHNMMNNLLPARTGELSYIYLLNKVHGRNTGEGIATLVIARVFDFIAIGGIFLCAVVILQRLPDAATQSALYALIAVLLSVVIIIILLKSDKSKILVAIGNLFGRYKQDKNPVGGYILCKLHEAADSFDALSSADMRFHLKVFTTTFGLWVSLYTFYYCMALAMHMDIGYIPAVFASSFAVFTTVLPIQGVGGFGTIEGGWAIGFILVGVPDTVAVASAFGFHLIMLIYTTLFGAGGYIFLKYAGSKPSPESTA